MVVYVFSQSMFLSRDPEDVLQLNKGWPVDHVIIKLLVLLPYR